MEAGLWAADCNLVLMILTKFGSSGWWPAAAGGGGGVCYIGLLAVNRY